jgi:hypothetical protein
MEPHYDNVPRFAVLEQQLNMTLLSRDNSSDLQYKIQLTAVSQPVFSLQSIPTGIILQTL